MMRGYGDDYGSPIIGHAFHGGGAKINNSPITVNLNFTINISEGTRLADGEGRPTEAGKTLGFLAKLFSGRNDGIIEDGRMHRSVGKAAIGNEALIEQLISWGQKQ